jgi:hypothetical protein
MLVLNLNLRSVCFRIQRLSINDAPKSEYHTQTSFIDPLMLGLCKFQMNIDSHSSNKTGYDDEKNVISGRPDYRIDVYEPPVFVSKYTNGFGEVKSDSPSTSCAASIHRIVRMFLIITILLDLITR